MKKELTALGYTQTDDAIFLRLTRVHKWYKKRYNFYSEIYVESHEGSLSAYLALDDGFAVIKHGATLEWIKEFDSLLNK